MADIATQHAQALAERFGEPVDVLGMSSGGSLALQLAADHPEVVRRLVVAGAAYTLTPRTREVQRRYTEAVAAGRRGAQHRDRLTCITAPTLIIGGGRDMAYPVELFRETAERLPESELIVYPGRATSGRSPTRASPRTWRSSWVSQTWLGIAPP
ncbi:lysophospholipase [Nonomuraea sp. NBC_00507]|uniref:alpha/beta fold hydrolase n=1 Tax=Nonomuraea sp. NBC_00507 TaxID=2976002 RepID=UPI002E18E3C4